MNEPPCLKAGQRMNPCAQALHVQTVEGRQDLAGEWWNGWKLRGPWLIGPGGMKFNARSLRAAWSGYLKAGLPGANADQAPMVITERKWARPTNGHSDQGRLL